MNTVRRNSSKNETGAVERKLPLKLLLVFVALGSFFAVAGCRRGSVPQDRAAEASGFVQGNFAFVPHGTQVLVIDVTQPDDPKQAAAWTAPGQVRKIVVSDNLAFVVHWPSVQSWSTETGPPDGGLQIVDIVDPHRPKTLGTYRTPDLAEDVVLVGGTAYVADWSGLRIVDVTNVSNPSTITSLTEGMSSITAVGDRLFGGWGGCSVRGWCAGGFWMADASLPTQPVEIGTVTTDELPGYDIEIVGDFAYLGGRGVWMVDLTDASQPTFAGHFSVPEGAYRAEVEASDSHLFLSSGDLRVFDLSETPALREVAHLDLNRPLVLDMALRDDYIYLAADGGLYVIDIGDPSQPTLAGKIDTAPIPVPAPSPTPVAMGCGGFSPQPSQLTSAVHLPADPNPPLSLPLRAPDPRYAVHTLFLDEPVAKMAADIGFDTVLQVFPWRDLNPSPGLYAWEASDHMVRMAHAHGLNLVVRLDMPPQWARTTARQHGLPFDPAAYADFVTAVARRYRGHIAAYIVWNEPNLSAEWSRSGEGAADHWSSERGWVADPADYVGILGLAFERIRQADPAAAVITAGLAPTNENSARAMDDRTFLRGMMLAGAADCFDVLGVHAYGYGLDPNSEQPIQDGLNLSRTHALRDIMLDANVDKPMWITELGYTLGSDGAPADGHPAVSAAQQGEYLVGALTRSRREWPWVQMLTVWNLAYGCERCDEASGFSLVEPDMTPRTSFFRMQAFLGRAKTLAVSRDNIVHRAPPQPIGSQFISPGNR